MIFVGIDVAKDKHDCFILNSEGTVLADVFTIANNRIGFETLLSRIQSCSQGESKIKVGLEATGHYSYNLLGFLLDSGLATYVINPLHTNLYRKSLSLRRTKTDRIDARTIAMMLMSDVDLKSYSNTAYHNEELKSLTRYRFDKVKERAKLKSSVARLVNILFPELEKLVSSLHIAVVYALLSNYPGASYIANANTEELAEILCTASKGRYTKSKTAEIQVAAGVSIGSKMPAKSMELKHTIALIRELDKEISEVESAIDKITSQMDSPIFTIPGIGRHMGAMILAEVGDFSNFASADKLLAYAGLSPSTYQSGQLQNCYAHMEKLEVRHGAGVGFSGIFNEPLSLRVKQGVVTAVGVFVDFAVSYACKAPGTSQSFAETADAGEHIYELDQGHNSLWGCLPDLRRCLIGAPHQKQKQPVTGCTEQDFFTVHNV